MARKAFKYLHIVQHISGNVGCISGTRIRRGVANYDRGGKGERVTSRGAVGIGSGAQWVLAGFSIILVVGFFFADRYFEGVNRSGSRPRRYNPLRFFLAIMVLISFVVYSFLSLLFVSGALFGDLYEKRKRWHSGSVSQTENETIYGRTAAAFSGPEKRPRQSTGLVIQALAPTTGAIIGLIGTVVQVSSNVSSP
jgi:hypothetical protein